MDYSAYYLKNQTDKKESAVRYRNGDFEFYRQEKEFIEKTRENEPQIIYIEDTAARGKDKAEVAYDLDATEYAVDGAKTKRCGGMSALRKGTIYALVLVICVLSAFVACDFLTAGGVFAAFLPAPPQETAITYYYHYSKGFDDYEAAKSHALKQRLAGGGGVIVRDGLQYFVADRVYTEKAPAEQAVTEAGGSVKTVQYDPGKGELVTAKIREKVLAYLIYADNLREKLESIADRLASRSIDRAAAQDELERLKTDFATTKAAFAKDTEKYADDDGVLRVATDMQVAEGLLCNLADEGLSRPNLMCDLRYTQIMLIQNACALAEQLKAQKP